MRPLLPKKIPRRSLISIIVIALLFFPSTLYSYADSGSLVIRAKPKDDVGKDGKIYATYPAIITISGCSQPYIVVKSDKEFHDYVSTDENGSAQPTETFDKPGTYTVHADCCRDVSSLDSGMECSNRQDSGNGETKVEVADPANIQPSNLPQGACEICPVDWGAYNGSEASESRCYSKEGDGVKYGQYKIKPIRTDTCATGYVCDHLDGCVVPTGGLTPPPLPCKRGLKYVYPPGTDPKTTPAPQKIGMETTDPSEIEKCLEVDTQVGGISIDPGSFVKSILGILLSISGMIAVFLIIRSGYQLMTSQGNPEAIQEARERLISALIGLVFLIFALVIIQVIGVDILHIPGFTP